MRIFPSCRFRGSRRSAAIRSYHLCNVPCPKSQQRTLGDESQRSVSKASSEIASSGRCIRRSFMQSSIIQMLKLIRSALSMYCLNASGRLFIKQKRMRRSASSRRGAKQSAARDGAGGRRCETVFLENAAAKVRCATSGKKPHPYPYIFCAEPSIIKR